jgi:uncharacterized OB-fold protein
MSDRPDRLLPGPAGLTGEMYAMAAQTGVLHLQRCDGCGVWRHPPRHRCAACGSAAWSWQPTAMQGAVFSWATTHRAVDPAFAGELPYAVVVVELDEGPRVVGNLVAGVSSSVLRLDLPVRVVLDRRTDAVALVDFEPR